MGSEKVLMEVIKKRRSIRRFLPKKIEDEKLDFIIEAARLAPSANNRQEWRFILVTDDEVKKNVSVAARNPDLILQAAALFVICAETDEHVMTCGQMGYTVDCAIAITHMVLAASSLGLGSCWVGAFYEDRIKKILGIPEKIRVAGLLPVGYPAESPPATSRLSKEQIMHYDKW
ncbi:MAG: nitroreductase family protein [bacterium]